MIDVGQRVGNYKVTAKLGEGGMGVVYLVQHPVIGSKMALKAIRPQFATNAEVVSRFVTEAKAVNRIGHNHIVDITDFGTTHTGEFYFIMEYLQGESLSSWIRRMGRFPRSRALHVAAQIADALNAAHEHGVIHRDLKPENIFLIERDETMDFVKVLDFGLAKLTGSDRSPTHNTRLGSFMGTPYYMSPEQCEGKTAIDHRIDVYALGVILFEMLTGLVPFGGDSYGEVILKHLTVPPPRARNLVPDLPPTIDAILQRALSKDPGQRFQTMADFRAALLAEYTEGSSGRLRQPVPTDGATAATDPDPSAPRSPLLPDSRRVSSTFRGSAGEVGDRDNDLRLPRRRGPLVALLAATALSGAAAFGLARAHQPGRFVRRPASVSLTVPTTVQVNINSDPDGAAVFRSDGVLVGTTPLSMQVPYGNTPVEFVLRKEGYLPKKAALVPSLPSPVFSVLERAESPTQRAQLAVQRAQPLVSEELERPHVTFTSGRTNAQSGAVLVHTSPARPRLPVVAPDSVRSPDPYDDDEDGVMEPSSVP